MPLDGLNIYTDFPTRRKIKSENAAGDYTHAAATGVVNWSVRISATRIGAAIGSLTGTATEYTTQGFYHYTFDTAALVTDLFAYMGQTVYVIWSRPGDANNYVTPFRVTDQTEVPRSA